MVKAVVAVAPGKDAVVKDKAMPTLGDKNIIIKTEAIALNPTDFKHMAGIAQEGAVIGCDFCGIVDQAGKSVTDVKKGDRVAGFVRGGYETDGEIGSFAEYSKTDGDIVWKVPDNVTPEEAAAIGGIAAETAAMALYSTLKLPQPGEGTSDETILIYSGATSVGMYAIQLAKASGLKVVTTASEDNHEYLKSIGADAAFDYKDPQVGEKVKKSYTITKALDCVSEKGSTKVAASCMDSGLIVNLLPVDAEKEGITNVKLQTILVYCCSGEHVKLYPGFEFDAQPELRTWRKQWLKIQSKLVADGKLKSNPLKQMDGGLDNVVAGMKHMQEGKHRRQKLVYKI